MTATNSNQSRATTLLSLIGQLSAKDQAFAASVCANVMKYGGSAKQMFWVEELITRATNPQATQRREEAVGDFTKVYALFQVARKKLQYPKVHLQLQDGSPIALAMSGPQSSRPNIINVTDGGPYGRNKWYGRVETSGAWTAGRSYPELDEVAALLKRLGEKPAETAAEYGRLTGFCCFCGTRLTDEKSTAVGYGPTCAKNYGLADEYKAGKPLFTALVEAEAAAA